VRCLFLTPKKSQENAKVHGTKVSLVQKGEKQKTLRYVGCPVSGILINLETRQGRRNEAPAF